MRISRRNLLLAGAATIAAGDARAWFPHGSPPLPPGTFPYLTLVSKTGVYPTQNITNNNTPAFGLATAAIAFAGDVVNIYDNAVLKATHTLSSGDISGEAFVLGLSFSDGVHPLTASYNGGTIGATLSITVDTVAPLLSSPTAAQNATNDTHSDLSVTTNKAQGFLYWVVTSSATPPAAAQVIAGKNDGGTAAISNGYKAVSVTNITATAYGVTTGTRYAYYVQQDLAGNNSLVAQTGPWTQTNSTGFDVLSTIAPNLWIAADNRLSLWQDIAGTIQVDSIAGAGQLVGQWTDYSGSSFNLTSVSDNLNISPQFQNAQYPCIRFNAAPPTVNETVAECLRKTSTLGLGTAFASHAGSTICVAIKPNPAAGKYLIGDDSSTATSEFFNPILSNGTTASTWTVSVRNDAGGFNINNQNVGTSVFDNTWKVLTFIDDGAGTIHARVNGIQCGTTSYSLTTGTFANANLFTLCARAYGGPGSFFVADVAEMVIKLSGSISGTDLAHLETYMGNKIGLSI